MQVCMHGCMDSWMHVCACAHVCMYECLCVRMFFVWIYVVCEYVCRFMLYMPFISHFYWHLLTYILHVESRPTHVYIVINAYMTYLNLDYIFYCTRMGTGHDRTTCLSQKTLAL